MNAEENSEHLIVPRSLPRKILGSALSAFVGWLALQLLILWGAKFMLRSITSEMWQVIVVVVVYSAAFVFATWLVLLLPLYLFVPSHSPLWRWPVCTFCGAWAGAFLMRIFVPSISDDSLLAFTLPAGFTGGVICLFGSLTANRFRHAERV